METWSHSPVKEFKITFFVDTNILCFLVDSTYSTLNDFFDYIKQNQLIDLISSEYVLLEFVGVRKREHYLREALNKSNELGKSINLSSLLKYHNQFSLPEIDFYSLLPQIKKNIDFEKEKISSEFGISFNCNFHQKLINPTSDICLSSKISKEDSLVLISSILPDDSTSNKNVILLTSDSDFNSWFNDLSINESINSIFETYEIDKPDLQYIKEINGFDNKKFNLTECIDTSIVVDNFNLYVCDNLKRKLNNLYIGDTFSPKNDNFPNDCLSIKIKTNLPILNNKYITIISKDLNFIYNLGHQVSFWNNGAEIDDEFVASDDNSHLSVKLTISEKEPDRSNILNRLKEAGNLIFYHPDN